MIYIYFNDTDNNDTYDSSYNEHYNSLVDIISNDKESNNKRNRRLSSTSLVSSSSYKLSSEEEGEDLKLEKKIPNNYNIYSLLGFNNLESLVLPPLI